MAHYRNRAPHALEPVDQPSNVSPGVEGERASTGSEEDAAAWPSELDAELLARDRDITDGRFFTAAEVIASLRAR